MDLLGRYLLLALVVYAVVVVLVVLFADRLMFYPPAASYGAGDADFGLVPVGAGDSVAVLHLHQPQARYTVLYSHGNAEDLGHVAFVLRDLREAGFAVIGYDYRGYGHSTGGPASARKASEDAEAVYRYAVDTLGIDPGRLILYGRSVGSGPTLELAARHDIAGVVLESAFTSAFRVVTRIRLFPFDRFPNLANIRALRAPVLVIHGTADEVVPFAHGRRLFDAAREPKQSLWVEGAGHNDVAVVGGARYHAALTRFIALIDAGPAAR
ncbi:MAG: alpha/beta hydrolase [Longimicrobiales bacterium]